MVAGTVEVLSNNSSNGLFLLTATTIIVAKTQEARGAKEGKQLAWCRNV
jgi:hypothetical protein